MLVILLSVAVFALPVFQVHASGDRINAFVSDGRWKNGAYWSYNQTPKYSTYKGCTGCCAYATDFAAYVYGINRLSQGGTRINSVSEIRTGDAVHIVDGYSHGQHWFVVLNRNGNNLYTAEGNYNNTVHVSSTRYRISGNTLYQDNKVISLWSGSDGPGGWHLDKGNSNTSLAVSSSKNTYSTGEDIIINWTSQSGAAKYGLTVRNSANQDVWDNYVTGNSRNIGRLGAGNYSVLMLAYDSSGKRLGDVKRTSFSVENVDRQAPIISNVYLKDIEHNGYTVVCNISDNVGVTSVRFPSWNSDIHSGNNAVWIEGVISGNQAYAWIPIDTLNAKGLEGNYITHIYAYDSAGNSAMTEAPKVYIDRTAPIIKNIKIFPYSDRYTITCKVEDSSGIESVRFPTWTEKNGQDDLDKKWSTSEYTCGKKIGDEYVFTVKFSDHNNEYGKYVTHIYAYDNQKNYTSVEKIFVNEQDMAEGEENINNSDGDIGYTGLVYENGYWLYYSEGNIDFSYTGLVQNEYGWWYVQNGMIDFDYTGLVQNEYGWWYVRNGAIDFNYNGLAQNAYGWWCIQNGAVDFSRTGLVYDPYVGWWVVQNGAINFNYNGLVYDPYVGWWVVNNGAINFGYTGMIANEYGWWFAVNGTLDFNATGWACNEYGWWLYYNGTIAWNYTGWWDGYYCVNGHLA